MLHYRLHCSCFISFSSVHTSLIMFHFYFLQSTVHLIYFIYDSPSRSCLPYLVAFILHGHSTSLSVFNLNFFQFKFLILDTYSLLEADLWWFYYSLSLCIKQETWHCVRRNVLVCSAVDVYLLSYSTFIYYSWIS